MPLVLQSPYSPSGDQPLAIEKLCEGLESGLAHQTLEGATGTGKTFTMANVISRSNRPTIIMAHNKTLAAQLYGEMKEYFPNNAVEYFVSYYDYYQPEAYVVSSDTFIEKDASINEHIEQMRLSATKALLEREDVIIIDDNATALESVEENSDVMTLKGNGTYRKTLIEAGVKNADIVVGVTSHDNTNLVITSLASELGAKRTVARVDAPAFFATKGGIERDVLGSFAIVCASRLDWPRTHYKSTPSSCVLAIRSVLQCLPLSVANNHLACRVLPCLARWRAW